MAVLGNNGTLKYTVWQNAECLCLPGSTARIYKVKLRFFKKKKSYWRVDFLFSKADEQRDPTCGVTTLKCISVKEDVGV